MPSCKLCGSHFPNIVLIDGKKKNLGSRKYCLDCSPFGKHNTTVLLYDRTEPGHCNTCGRDFLYAKGKGHRTTKCNSCVVRERKKKIKAKAVAYKGGKCIECGYSKSNAAMHFHHIDPGEKDFSIAGSYNRSWNKIQNELDKCILLCANCHAEIHESLGLVSDGKTVP